MLRARSAMARSRSRRFFHWARVRQVFFLKCEPDCISITQTTRASSSAATAGAVGAVAGATAAGGGGS